MLGTGEVLDLDIEDSGPGVVGVVLEQTAEHRIAVEAEQAAPNHARPTDDQRDIGSVADLAEWAEFI